MSWLPARWPDRSHDNKYRRNSLTNKPSEKINLHEHTVPLFWPYAAAMELGKEGLKLFRDNLRFIGETEKIIAPPESTWATLNRVRLDLDTMRLRDFSHNGESQTPVLVDAPYAGHSATIADFAKGQSLVETLQKNGLQRVFVTDWKSATEATTSTYYGVD